MPKSADLEALNELCRAGDVADDARHVATRRTTVGEDFALEQGHLLVLPEEPFDAARYLPLVRVDHKARVCVRQCYYSVPARLVGRRLSARLGASFVELYEGATTVARHARLVHRGDSHLVLDHYLPVLFHKPGALAGSVALAQARAEGVFGAEHDAFWLAARHELGDGAGTRALCEVLLLHRRLPDKAVRAAMTAVLHAGVVDPKLVAVEARRFADGARDVGAIVTSITDHRGDRPAPTLVGYDALLGSSIGAEVAG